jgi:predicted transposase/invertase (TIGR01784 family)
MAKYLDPKVDFLFKKIFGENKDLLISFLNSFLPLEDEQEVIEIEYLSPEMVPVTPLGKNSIVDVRCTDNHGRAFIVEMQSEWTNIFRKRLIVNGSKAIIKQMDKKSVKDEAKLFQDLQPVYVLAAVNSTFSEGNDWYHTLKIMNPKNHAVLLEGLEFILLELPKFNPVTWSLAQKKLAILWLRFLKEIDGYYNELPEEFITNKLIFSAIQKCEEAALTSEEREAYERSKEQVMWDRSIKGLEDAVVEKDKIIADKDQALAYKDQVLADKDQALADKDQALSENAKTIAEQTKELTELRKILSKIKI